MHAGPAAGPVLRLCSKLLLCHGSYQYRCSLATSSQYALAISSQPLLQKFLPRTMLRNWGSEAPAKRLRPKHRPEVQTDISACAAFWRSCGNGQLPSDGKLVHEHVIKGGVERNNVWGDLLLQMYGICGRLEDAIWVFERIPLRDRFSWNILIRIYTRLGKAEVIFRIYGQMLQEGVLPDKYTIVSILSACSTHAAFSKGKQIHACIWDSPLELDLEVGNNLLNMYRTFDNLEGARRMFDRMCERDTVTWTAMIAAYAQLGHSEEAFRIFDQMDLEGVKGDKITFITILSACVKPTNLMNGTRIHKLISRSGLDSEVAVGNALLNMYRKCGSLESAENIFFNIISKNEITWTAMINAYAENGNGQKALELFCQMKHKTVQPNKITYISLFSACNSKSLLSEGKRLHSSIANSGLESDVSLGTALVTMYSRCGDLEEARKVFDKICQLNIRSWNAMLSAYGQHGQIKDALQLFGQMLKCGITPDKVTFISMVSAFTSKMALEEGKAMHSQVVGSGLESNTAVANALTDMYGKCGSTQDAWINFEQMQEWDKLSFISILSACASNVALTKGMKIHAHLVACGVLSDVGLTQAIVQFYCKCGSIKDAWKVFEGMQERDCAAWSNLIAAYGLHGQDKEALELFHQMQKEGILPDKVALVAALSACASQGALVEGKWIHTRFAGNMLETDVIVGNSLVDMYSKCGALQDARRVFDNTFERDSISWTAMIAALAKHGQGKDAFNLFNHMQQEGFMPDKATFVSVLCACASQSVVEGKRIHTHVLCCGVGLDVYVGTALINMYGKHGNLVNATRTFEHMPEQTLFTWNSMMTMYAQHGQGALALQVYAQMQKKGVQPDNVTYVSVFSACSHSGLVEEGFFLFVSMVKYCCFMPILDHYNCIIDLLGRAGTLDMAEDLASNMPAKPSFVSWLSLLNACTIQFDLERRHQALRHLVEFVGEKTTR